MNGHVMRVLFVKGEVTSCEERLSLFKCHVLITNDGYYVCEKIFHAEDEVDLEKQFYDYLGTESFQQKIYHSREGTTT